MFFTISCYIDFIRVLHLNEVAFEIYYVGTMQSFNHNLWAKVCIYPPLTSSHPHYHQNHIIKSHQRHQSHHPHHSHPTRSLTLHSSTQAPTSSRALLGSVFLFNKNPWISAGLNLDSGTLDAKEVAIEESSVAEMVLIFDSDVGVEVWFSSFCVFVWVFVCKVVGVRGGVRVPLIPLLMSGWDLLRLVVLDLVVGDVFREAFNGRGKSSAYIRSNSSLVCTVVAAVNATWWSTRPGRISAESRFSGRLVVITRTRPSWDATPGFG